MSGAASITRARAAAGPCKSGISSSTRHPGAWRRMALTVAAKCAAPPSARSSRFTEGITTCSSPSSPTARAAPAAPPRLLPIPPLRAPMGHGAVAAVPRAHITENHERRGEVLPAFADIRAVGLFAHRMEVPLPHETLETEVLRPARRPHLEPGRLGQRGRRGWIQERERNSHQGLSFFPVRRRHYCLAFTTRQHAAAGTREG